MFLRHLPLFNEAPAAEAAPVLTDHGGDAEVPGESSFFDKLRQADDHPDNVARKQQEAPKPEVKPLEKKADPAQKPEPKKAADKLGSVEEEVVEEEKPADEEPPPEGTNEKGLSRWKQLKAKEKVADELTKKVEAMTKEMEELRKSPVSKEVQEKLEELQKFRDIHDVKRSKEYQESVIAPLAKAEKGIEEVCGEFKIDMDKMLHAMSEVSEWKRSIAIDKLVEEADDAPAAIKASLYKMADQLHVAWQKGAEIESKASELRAAQEALANQGNEKQTYEQQQAWQKALAASKSLVETKLAPVLKGMTEDERKEFTSSIENATISDDPEERALQAQSPQVAAVLIRRLNNLTKEFNALKKERDTLIAARPGARERQTDDGDPNVPSSDEDFMARVRQADDYMRR
jgi:hypothetical protein